MRAGALQSPVLLRTRATIVLGVLMVMAVEYALPLIAPPAALGSNPSRR